MSRRNLANYDTFNTVYLNKLDIQTDGNGLSIYAFNSTVPSFVFNPVTSQAIINGDLLVSGSGEFDSIAVTEYLGGIFNVATDNAADAIDIGLAGKYVNGGDRYAGFARDASDTLKRFTFFKEILSQPVTDVVGLDSTKWAGILAESIHLNDGSASAPSIAFDIDLSKNTGFYRAGEDSIGITAGGEVVATISRTSGSLSNFTLNTDTILSALKINTVDDSVLSGGITTGHLYIESSSATDKWFKLHSASTAGTPAYAGAVFSSPTDYFFVSNVGSTFKIFGRTHSDAVNVAPDYRAANTEILALTTTTVETKLPLIIPFGSLGSLAIRFNSEATTGIYRSGSNAIGIVGNGANLLNISDSNITASRAFYNIDGTVSLPSITFTNNTDMGLYRAASNTLGVSVAGVNKLTLTTSALSITTGNTVNVGTSGTTSPLNVYGLATIYGGITSVNGQSVNVGTSGTASPLNVYGVATVVGQTILNGVGGSALASSSVYIAPASTTSTASDYYFTSYAIPTLTSAGVVTVPNAYTVYIAGAPAQAGSTTITNPYALVVASGRSYFGGQLLASDGTVGAPSIAFVSDSGLDTGFYRIGEGNIGLTINGTKQIDIASTTTSWTTGHTVNIGTSGTTSILNIYGAANITKNLAITTSGGGTSGALSPLYIAPGSTAVTGSNNYYFSYFATPATTGSTTGAATTVYIDGAPTGTVSSPFALFVSSGATRLANMTATTISASGLITASLGLTVSNNTVSILGAGSSTVSSGSLYIAPQSTTVTSSANYYTTYMERPTLTSGSAFTVPIAATLYIKNSPLAAGSTTITDAYSIYVESGNSYFGGSVVMNSGFSIANGQTMNIGTSGTTATLNVFGVLNVNSISTFTGVGSATNTTSTVVINPASTTVSGSNNYYFTSLKQPATSGSTTGAAYTLFIEGAPVGTITNPYSLYVAAGLTLLQALTSVGLITANAGITVVTGQTLNVGTSGTSSPLNVYGLITGSNGLTISSGATSLQALTTNGLLSAVLGITITNGQTLNVGTSGSSSPANIYGLISGFNGLTISSGATSLQALTTNGLLSAVLGITITTGQTLNVGTSGTTSPANIYGLITGSNGLTITSGATSLQALTTNGLLTAALGLNVTNGQTANIGTSGTSTPLNVYGLITGANGLTISSGASSLQALTTNGLLTAALGATITTGQTLNVGTSGTTSPANIYGLITGSNGLTISSGATSLQALTTNGLLTAAAGLTISAGTFTLTGPIVFTSSTVIRHNTTDGSDTNATSITGGGDIGSNRGGRIIVSGNERVINAGKVQIFAGDAGVIEFGSNGDTVRGTVDQSGVWTLNTAIASTSSSTGVLVLSTGGLAIGGSTNATSYINGGGITDAGGLAVALDAYVGLNLAVGVGTTLDGERSLRISNVSTGTSAYSIMRLQNSGGLDGVIFLNSTTRTTDGGTNTMTIRNDAGSLRLQTTSAGSSTIILNSSGITTLDNATASTSGSTGALVLSAGGLAIGNTTDSVSATNGGGGTVLGGFAIAKTLRVGIAAYIRNGSWTSNGDDVFINANGGNAIALRPTAGSSSNEVYNNTVAFNIANSTGTIFASFNHANEILNLTGTGNTTAATGSFRVAPTSTTATASNYFFTTYEQPTLTSVGAVTVPNAYTVYIAGAPAQAGSTTITNPYALYVASGASLFQAVTISGTFTPAAGITIPNGQTLNVGTSGTTSPANIYGLITGSNGLTISSGATSLQALTTNGLLTAALGINVTTGQTANIGTSGTTSPLNVYGLITGSNGLTITSGLSSVQALTAAGVITASLGLSVTNGQTLNVGTSGTSSTLNVFGVSSHAATATFTGVGNTTGAAATLQILPASTTATASSYFFSNFAQPTLTSAGVVTVPNAYTIYVENAPAQAGSTTITNAYAIYVAGGRTRLSTLTANGLISSEAGITITTGQTLNVGTSGTTSPANIYGLITGTNGLTISSGTTSLQATTTSGKLTAFTGIDISNGQVLNVGVSGTTATLNVYGFVSIANGLTVFGGATSLQATTTNGLLTANAGITSANGQIVNVGTSGTSSTLNVFGASSHAGTASFTAVGSTTFSTATSYFAPATTTATAADYYFNYYASPTLTSVGAVTVPNAYTVYIAGPPAQAGSTTITNPYALVVASGRSYFGGQILASDGTAGAPSYGFVSDTGLDTGFYRIGEGNIGVTINSTKRIDIAATITSWTTGHTVNIGTSGTTSPLNVFGLITGNNGLTISSGATSVQALTVNSTFTPAAGITIPNGQTLNVGTSGTTSPTNAYGLITGYNGLTINSGATSLQALTTNGLLSAVLGINVTTGQTVNIGSTGTTSPLNVYGLITGSNGLSITAGTTTLPTDLVFSADSIIRRNTSDGADTGFLVITGGGGNNTADRGAKIVMFGNEAGGAGALDIIAGNAAGGTIKFYTGNQVERGSISLAGIWTIPNTTILTGTGNTTFANGTFFINPATTTSSAATHYFSSFNQPTLTSVGAVTVPNAYTIYIADAPASAGATTITNPYALYVANGRSFFGGQILASSGTVSLPGYSFASDTGLDTGFYRIGEGNIGITINSTKQIDIASAVTSWTTGHTINVGTSGTSSPLNVYGLITGSNGLTLSAGSVTIGQLGTYTTGSIYSDSNWGMLFRARQASPTIAEFAFANSADTKLFAILSSGNVGVGTITPLTRLSTFYGGGNDLSTTPYYNFGMELRNSTASGANDRSNMILFTDNNSTQAAIGAYRDNFSSNYLGGLLFLIGSQPGGYTQAAPTTITEASNSLTEAARFTPTGVFALTGTTASTSSTTGIMTLPGGLGISNTTDAVSFTNGGAGTIAGGFAIAKSLRIGGWFYLLNTYWSSNGNDIFLNANSDTIYLRPAGTSANQVFNSTTSFGIANGSGTTFASFNHSTEVLSLTGTGNTTAATGSFYVAPASTAVTGSNNYFFSSYAIPTTTGSTTGSAYTMYIEGAPSGTITSPYALYVAAGVTRVQDLTVNGTFTPAGGLTMASDLIFSTNSIIRRNTSDGSDTGYLVFTGGGADSNADRGSKVFSFGNENGSFPGLLGLAAGNVASGAIKFYTGNQIERASINNSGVLTTLYTTTLTGVGNTTGAAATLQVLPASTTATASSYFFSNFAQPTLTSAGVVTVPNAYTIYVENAPAQAGSTTITNRYALYVAAGNSFFGGQILAASGTVSLPGYSFASDSGLNTGFYRIGEGNIGVTIDGVKEIDISATTTTWTNNHTVNVGTSGTGNALHVYGNITNGGFDFVLGVDDQSTRGDSGQSRALVKEANETLVVNYAGDFQGGTEIQSALKYTGGFRKGFLSTASTTVALVNLTHNIVECTAGTAVAVTLPSITSNEGREFIIIRSGAGTVTIGTTSSQTIDDGVTTSISLNAQYDRVTLICGSTQWYTV